MEGTVITDSPAPISSDQPDPGRSGRASATRALEQLAARPFLYSLIACIALGALSAAVLPTVPSYDPWSWIVWGREATDPHLNFTVGGGPSWKPLPWIFTVIYSKFGDASPTLWVATARVGGLMACVGAYRLAALLVARLGYRRATPVAGVVAIVGIALCQDMAYYWYRGTSEPILVACALWAVERLLLGKRWQAFWLGVALAMMRPESWPFLLLLAAWLFLREPRTARMTELRSRALVIAGLVSVPASWFGPPWVGTGKPFIAASHAKDYNGHLGAHPIITVFHRGAGDQPIALFVLAAIAVAVTLYKERDRWVLLVAAGAAAWWVVVVAMTKDGYPGLERFYLPAAALICVLAGVGVVRIGAFAGELVAHVGPPKVVRPAAIAAGLAAAIIASPFLTNRIDDARAQQHLASQASTRLDQLSDAIAAVGGHKAIYPCGTKSFAAINHSLATAAAWKLHTTLEGVGTAMRYAGVMFVGPHDSIDGGPPAIAHSLNRRVLIKQVGVWKVYRVYRYGHLNHCIGPA